LQEEHEEAQKGLTQVVLDALALDLRQRRVQANLPRTVVGF